MRSKIRLQELRAVKKPFPDCGIGLDIVEKSYVSMQLQWFASYRKNRAENSIYRLLQSLKNGLGHCFIHVTVRVPISFKSA